jgi:hypothetical protein
MAQEWQALTKLTGGAPIEIERVRLTANEVAIEGRFELPALAQLTAEDQTFVTAFVKCHGSIKQMEKYFGISYPTVKNRLNRIGAQLPFVEMEQDSAAGAGEVLSRLERGEITVAEALAELKTPREEEKQ